MEYQKIEFSESELKSFQQYFPDSLGARLLNRMMVENAQEYERILHDPASSLEQIRFSQGALDCQGKLIFLIQKFMEYKFDQVERDDESRVDDGEEAVPDVNF